MDRQLMFGAPMQETLRSMYDCVQWLMTGQVETKQVPDCDMNIFQLTAHNVISQQPATHLTGGLTAEP